MSSLMKTLEMFIAENPGLTSREIAEAFADYSIDAVQRTVCRLHEYNFTTREWNGKQFLYYAMSESAAGGRREVPADKHVEAMIDQAKELQNRGLYRRAATLWMEAFQRSQILTERERCLKERQRCLRKAVSTSKADGSWFLAGRYAGEN